MHEVNNSVKGIIKIRSALWVLPTSSCRPLFQVMPLSLGFKPYTNPPHQLRSRFKVKKWVVGQSEGSLVRSLVHSFKDLCGCRQRPCRCALGPGRRTAPRVQCSHAESVMRRALAVCLRRPELQLLRHDGLFPPFGPDAQSRRLTLVNRRESIALSRLVLSRALGVWSLLVLVIAVGTRAAEPVCLLCFSGAPNVRGESRDSFLVYHLLQVSSPSFRFLL